MGINIFAILMTLLSLSDRAVDMGCDAPPAIALECWIVTPETGATVWMTEDGISYANATQPIP